MSTIDKIIYLIQAPFNKRDYKRFGLEIFIQEGFEVYVWDFTPFLYPSGHKLVTPPDPILYKNLIHFKHKSDAIAAINKEGSNSFVISVISFNITTFSIFRAISKNKISYALITANAYPTINSNKNIKSLIKKASSTPPKELINRLFMRLSMIIPLYFLNIKPANFILAGGAKSLPKSTLANSDTEVLLIHTFDYDFFLDKPNSDQPEDKFIVFLDEDLPFHSDFIFLGLTSPISPEAYYPVLCRFFDQLEEKTGLEVIITAQPRSHFEKRPDLFGGRKIERGKTAELVRNAKLVILHCSNAINFPILYKKPMIFVTTDSINKTRFRKYMDIFASYLRKTPINISKEVNIDLRDELFMYEEGYARYKHDFIKLEGSDELPFWQIVANRIKLS